MKKQLLFLILVLSLKNIFSQAPGYVWGKPVSNFYSIQEAFYDYWKGKDITVKGMGYKQFKRWEYFTEPRVYPSGNLTLISTTWANYEEYLKKYNSSTGKNINSENQIASTTYTAMGPFGPLTGLADNNLPRKAGRDNFITFHPTNPNTYWVGSPAGGLWKTTNNGASWTTNTDNLGVIGCTDMAIDPTNPNVMYLATGDGYWYSTASIGVLKSIDGGVTWNSTGLVFSVSQGVQMRRVLIDPSNTQNIFAATVNGIYKSTAGGAGAWTLVSGANTYDMEFNAAGSNTVYASGINFSVSTNGGASFATVTNGLPGAGTGGRIEIAVTPANPNYVYLIKSNVFPSNENLQGVYRSINAGVSFSTMATSPNILSADCFTPSTDGQGNYDLTIAASPLNASVVTVGGINIWQSANGGSTWTNIGCAYGTGNPPFIHADHHEIQYTTAGTLYSTNDGGICQYTGSAWNDLTAPRNIAQIYKIGLSALSPNLWISGHQDNGSNIYDNGIYKASLMGDGMDCFIDRTNDQNLFASKFNGAFYKSTDGGTTWNPCVVGMPGAGAFVTPWKQDPQTATTLWAGKSQMYKSTNLAGNWIQSGTLAAVSPTQKVTEFAIAPSNNQIAYTIHGTTGVFKTIDGGATWSLCPTGLPAGLAATFITIHPTNPNIAWVTYSGYSAGNKVFKTTNGGTNWSSLSGGSLPNIPANCSVYEPGNVNDRIYIGMDVGVYYIDNTMLNWALYNTGLPNTPVMDMEISPASPNKIRIATFGRGVYQVDLVPNAAPPVTAFNYIGNVCTLASTLILNDNSSNAPTSWSWTVSPAGGVTINTPTSQNPTITIASPGAHTISLVASNGFGAGTLSSQTVSISSPTITATANASVICTGQSVSLTASGANTYTWQPGNIVGATANYTPAATQNYTVSGTGINGCGSSDTLSVFLSPCTGVIGKGSGVVSFSVFPNPAADKLSVSINVLEETDFVMQLTDLNGKQVLKYTAKFGKDKNEQDLNIAALAKGFYLLRISSKAGVSQVIKILKE